MTDFYVHPSSIIDEGAEIGPGTNIWHFCHIMSTARIGANCTIGQNVFIAADVIIGSNVKIQNNVSLYTGVVVEDDVFLGPSVVLTNVINPRSHVSRKDEYKSTLIRRGASLGANATILCGATLGEYSFVGAGSIVTSDVPDYALVYGNPARTHGWMCQCGIKLQFEEDSGIETTACKACGAKYSKTGETVKQK